MHQPQVVPHRSLYFPYQVYPAFVPSPGILNRSPVVIVGAGPIGLTLALELARHGVRSIVLAAQQQVCEGSRAIVFTRRSMEIFQQVGVSGAVTEQGLPWRFGNSYYRGQRVFRMEAPVDPHDRFAPMTNLQQQYLEQHLVEAAQAQPLIEVRWGNKVIDIEQGVDGAVLQVDTPSDTYSLEADWVVAADGARSGLRSLLGLKLEGASYEGRFVIADIRIKLDLPTERLAFFDPAWNPGNTVLMHREPGDIWRIDYQLPVDETPEQALHPDSLRERINAQLAMLGVENPVWELDWSSVYSARALTLAQYINDRVIFAGDAAHLLPIFGVRGANTGFQDCHDLGWKLALHIKGLAGAGLLASYSDERVRAAREIIEEAGKSTRFMAPPSRGYRLLRDAVLSLSLTREFVRPLYHWRTSRAHDYADSQLNAVDDDNLQFTDGPRNGAPLLNVRLADQHYLFDELEPAFHLICFTGAAVLDADVDTQVQALHRQGVPVQVIAIAMNGVSQVEHADLTLADPDGLFSTRYGVQHPGAAYLARPDQHVCARWLHLDGERLRHGLNQALGHNKSNQP
ncbi:monooxygenase [Pseudomonas silesiensis]|uniref:Monooxygenase n=1 Tax=Pseudomonas silesiensis TaxID=1853130 RepID=A0A191YVZ1_9PSED|nr:FAD-dependent monooxygenase [Pseudomonas silesiensis]ANJ56938.1 monooxygenase [Pseudomonas silesiensis]